MADTTSAELVLALYELGVSFYHGWGVSLYSFNARMTGFSNV